MDENHTEQLQALNQGISEISNHCLTNTVTMRSLYNNPMIVKKLEEELSSLPEDLTVFDDLIDTLLKICRDVRNEGILYMETYYGKKDNALLNDVLYMFINDLNWVPIKQFILPRLLHPRFNGIKFIEGVLIYESLSMVTAGYPVGQITYTLSNIIGYNFTAEECLKND